MQGRHEKRFLGLLRASWAIKKMDIFFTKKIIVLCNINFYFISFISAFHVLLATKPYVPELIIRPMLEDLQETLEKTENHLIVPTLVNSLALISRQQPRLFEPRFQVTALNFQILPWNYDVIIFLTAVWKQQVFSLFHFLDGK